MYAARTLATYISACNADNLTRSIRDKTLCCMLDVIASAVAGYETSSALAVRRVAANIFGPGPAAVWFSGQALSSTGAAFCNAAAASALDLDDGHRAARGHPGAAVIPTVLALASDASTPSGDIITAITLGYEIGVRIAAAQNPNAIRSRQSGRWAGYAAVAAAGKLSGMTALRLSQALAISGVLAPNQDANGSSGYSQLTGNDVKEGIPWAVATGMTALHLARSGYTGPEDILDHASHYDTASILKDLTEPRKIEGVYFKPYACCRYIHPALDAFSDLNGQHGLVAEEIASIEVQTFAWALKLGNRLDPENLTDIQYSLPYCVAITAVDGDNALAPIGAHLLNRPDLSRFARQVRITVDEEIDRRFPTETLARVVMVDRRGHRFVSSVTTPRGDVGRPMDWGDIREKFLRITAPTIGQEKQRALLNGFERFKLGDPAPLLGTLRQPLDR
ncbi:MAG: MmgE/PrpD family protein [Rhizobium sp.]|nr:MmgE/PrpD family protein [Rhizobium sp.]